ncbi:MAG TPA: UbiA family prenyltransferase [Bryobacteraceae bacterium]
MASLAESQPFSAREQSPAAPPLVVDLDRTLVKTDLLLESIVALLRQRPWLVFALPIWLAGGLPHFKREVARRVSLDVSLLPYREKLLAYLKTQRIQGRTIALATTGDSRIARQVADHLGLFDLIIASSGMAGNAGVRDRPAPVDRPFEKGPPVAWEVVAREYVRALRLRHWLKNLLVFVPLLAAHRVNDFALVGRLLLSFLAFGCVASGGYLINDLLDLQADRRHPSKRLRPFADGDLPLSYALVTIPALLSLGFLIGKSLSSLFLAALLVYFGLNLAYALVLKRIVVLDVIVLASLYGLRILAGSAVVSIWPSHWLLAFSTFLFFSLALVKRYSELVVMRRLDGDRAKARGYEDGDGELVAAMGVASGYLAVLVLALYINSETAQILYRRNELIWLLCPLLLYWISHVWLTAHRGRMPDDPVMFAMNNRTSRILIALMTAMIVLAL